MTDVQGRLAEHTEAIVKCGLQIQEEIDRKEASAATRKERGPMQVGQREYPAVRYGRH
jgi:hypothetical protein